MGTMSHSSERGLAEATERARPRRRAVLILLAAGASACAAQPSTGQPAGFAAALTPAQAQALVGRALQNELNANGDTGHPMRYVLHKSSPRVSTTKEICETRDGAVARLIAVNDQPLSAADEEKEQARLSALERDPGMQRHRKQSEDADAARALRVLSALPKAFLYQYAGPLDTPSGPAERFTFKPNPAFSPPDLETAVLAAMSGEIRIDPASERVTRLEAHLDKDVDFGWGILGRLYKGGWITMDQANVGGGAWRLVRFEMKMSGRMIFRTRVFDTTEAESQFAPAPLGMTYTQAIEAMRHDETAGQDVK